jgi:hypothetical protein
VLKTPQSFFGKKKLEKGKTIHGICSAPVFGFFKKKKFFGKNWRAERGFSFFKNPPYT